MQDTHPDVGDKITLQDAGQFIHGDAEDDEEYSSEDTEFVDNTPVKEKSAHGSSQKTNPSQKSKPSQLSKSSQQSLNSHKSSTSHTPKPSQNLEPSQQPSNSQKSITSLPQSTSQHFSQDVPDRIQQDMNFLQKSWENLADLENEQHTEDTMEQQKRDIDIQIAQEIQHNIDESGFQLVTSKGTQKKVKNNRNNEVSSSYKTRSKVVKPLPFK